MKKLYKLFIIAIIAFCAIPSIAQNITNRGTEFWVAYGHHQFMESTYGNDQNMTLYLATGDSAAEVTIQIDSSGTIGGPWTRIYTIPANTAISIADPLPAGVTVTKFPSCIAAVGPIPKGAANDCGFDARLIAPPPPTGTGGDGLFRKKGIHITATAPILAYAHIYGNVSSGATMLLPVNAWGNNYTTINSNQNNADNAFSWVFVVANHDNTTVEITPSAPTRTGKPAGVPFTVTLNKGQIYQVVGALNSTTSGYQLTGTTVRSIINNAGEKHPIAVFAGSSRTGGEAPCNLASGRDNDIQQVFPEETWGKRYLLAPMAPSSTLNAYMTNTYKIAVSDPTTVVRRNGVVLSSLTLNKYYTFVSSTPDYIEADKPIMVAQFMSGGSPCNPGDGDPEMVYWSPLEQSIRKTRFYRTTVENITANLLLLVIPTSGINSLRINDTIVASIPAASKYVYSHPVLPGYSVVVRKWPAAKAQCSVQSDSAFVGITYGVGGAESYGYNVGTYYDTINPNVPKYNVIEGLVYLDANRNAVYDSSERLFNQGKIVIEKNGLNPTSTITATGQFYNYVDTGTYVTKFVPYSTYYDIVPASHTTVDSTFGNRDILTIAAQPIAAKRDLSIVMTTASPARPGSAVDYKIMYLNSGTDTVTGTIQFIKSTKLNFLSASVTPASVSGDTLRWNVVDLRPIDTGSIILHFRVPTPPTVQLGDTLKSLLSMSSSIADLTPADNVSVVTQRVVGSYDPNDKTENHGGEVRSDEIAAGGYLQYTIRFQNTGTDTAANVYIRDTLDNRLDWSSLRMISTSHNYQLTINDGRTCLWSFNNIKLVDSNRNESKSHGYITYIIKPKGNTGVGDTVKNRASIYFDFNPPVATNEVKTVVVSSILPVRLVSFIAKKEGKNNIVQWRSATETALKEYEVQRSIDGNEFSKIGSERPMQYQYAFLDAKPAKAVNYYRLKMIDADGKTAYSEIRSVNNTEGFYATVFPNPAKDKIQLLITSDKKESVEMQITGFDGKILVRKQLSVNEGSTVQTVDVLHFASGKYLLVLKSSSKEQTGIQFDKL